MHCKDQKIQLDNSVGSTVELELGDFDGREDRLVTGLFYRNREVWVENKTGGDGGVECDDMNLKELQPEEILDVADAVLE